MSINTLENLLKSNPLFAGKSPAEVLANMGEVERAAFIAAFDPAELTQLMNQWLFWARPKQRLPEGNWFTWLLMGGRGFGKALGLSVEVPTPYGMSTIGDIKVGDYVYAPDGSPTRVDFITDLQENHDVFNLVFKSGKTVPADADHEWLVDVKYAEKSAGNNNIILTTREINLILFNNPNSVTIRIKNAKPVKSETELTSDYLRAGVEALLADNKTFCPAFSNEDGILNDLPPTGQGSVDLDEFMQAVQVSSARSKLKFLSYVIEFGLYVKSASMKRVWFTNLEVANFVRVIADSIGLTSFIKKDARQCGPRRVEYNGYGELSPSVHPASSTRFSAGPSAGQIISNPKEYKIIYVMHLDSKVFGWLESLQESGLSAAAFIPKNRNQYHEIVACSRKETEPVKCLQVEHDSHMFLITDEYIPTHNTRTGAEAIREWVKQGYKYIGLIGQTVRDVRDTMLLGESGLITICKNDDDVPEYIASRRVVIWPKSGAEAHLYSGDEPEQLRGPQHEKAWMDEPIKFKRLTECMDNLELGLRLGDNPQLVVTTTPKPIKYLKEAIVDEDTVLTTGSTYENTSHLSKKFIKRVEKKYGGTRLGKQELFAQLLTDVKGALWNSDLLRSLRVFTKPIFKQVIVAIDPAVTSKDESDETGIVVVGLTANDIAYVLADYTDKYTPGEWVTKAVNAFHEFNADYIVGEVNNGGDLIEFALRTAYSALPYKSVWASRDKYTRATPVATLYEQMQVYHYDKNSVNTRDEEYALGLLEEELTTWVPGNNSPNRLDALVWGITALKLSELKDNKLVPITNPIGY